MNITNVADEWAATLPEGYYYDPNQCQFAQQGVSLWKQTAGDVFENLSLTQVVTYFLNETHPPYFTCGKYLRIDRETHLKMIKGGLGVYTAKKKNKRDTGSLEGVQVWLFLYYEMPEDLLPEPTQTVPPDPDATTTTTVAPTTAKHVTTVAPTTTKNVTTVAPTTTKHVTTVARTTTKHVTTVAPPTTMHETTKTTDEEKEDDDKTTTTTTETSLEDDDDDNEEKY